MDEEDVVAIMSRRIAEAEKRMIDNFNEALFSGGVDSNYIYIPPTRWQKLRTTLRRIYYFFNCRIIGIYEVLRYGETQRIREDDY